MIRFFLHEDRLEESKAHATAQAEKEWRRKNRRRLAQLERFTAAIAERDGVIRRNEEATRRFEEEQRRAAEAEREERRRIARAKQRAEEAMAIELERQRKAEEAAAAQRRRLEEEKRDLEQREEDEEAWALKLEKMVGRACGEGNDAKNACKVIFDEIGESFMNGLLQ